MGEMRIRQAMLSGAERGKEGAPFFFASSLLSLLFF